MEERTKIYKTFHGKAVFLKTKSGFSYHTKKLEVRDDCVFFIDKLGYSCFLSFDEIGFISQEEQNG